MLFVRYPVIHGFLPKYTNAKNWECILEEQNYVNGQTAQR